MLCPRANLCFSLAMPVFRTASVDSLHSILSLYAKVPITAVYYKMERVRRDMHISQKIL